MQTRFIRAMVVSAMLLVFPLPLVQAGAPAQATKAPPAAPAAAAHDLQGVWDGNLRAEKPPAMKPPAQARFNDNTAELRQGRPLTKDPTFQCDPPGVPHVYANGIHPFEIVQTTNRIFLFYESAHMWRTIWMDGRALPKEVDDPLWLGYSVGHWEGNDLVVETVGFNDKTWLDTAGHPHSENLRVTERFRRVDRDDLQIDFSLSDPEFYDETWTLKGTYKLRPTWEIGEAFCLPEEQRQFDQRVLAPNAKP